LVYFHKIQTHKMTLTADVHNHFYEAENTSENTPMSNENEFTSFQDGRDCLPERIDGVKNKKQSSVIDIQKSQNHKRNHEVTNEITAEITDFEILCALHEVVDPHTTMIWSEPEGSLLRFYRSWTSTVTF